MTTAISIEAQNYGLKSRKNELQNLNEEPMNKIMTGLQE